MGSRQGLLWAQSCLVITEPEPSAGAKHTGRAHSTPQECLLDAIRSEASRRQALGALWRHGE